MEKINKPINLIGFYSDDMIAKKKKPTFTPRMAGYSGIIVILFSVLTYFVMQRGDVDVTIMRSAGMLYQDQPGGYISNIYNADLINKTDKPQDIRLVTDNPSIKIKYIQASGILAREGSAKSIFFVMMPGANIHAAKTAIKIRVMQQNKVLSTINTTFIGPVNE
jgi:polyferredoxin